MGPSGAPQTPSRTVRRPSINIKLEEPAMKQEQDVEDSAEREGEPEAVTDEEVQLLLEFRSHVMSSPGELSFCSFGWWVVDVDVA